MDKFESDLVSDAVKQIQKADRSDRLIWAERLLFS